MHVSEINEKQCQGGKKNRKERTWKIYILTEVILNFTQEMHSQYLEKGHPYVLSRLPPLHPNLATVIRHYITSISYIVKRIILIRSSGLFGFRIWLLKLMNLFWTLGRTPGWVISLSQGHYLHVTAQHRKNRTRIHASSGIRNREPSIRAIEDSTCLRPRGHLGRLLHSVVR